MEKIGLLFPGQGSQSVGMGEDLYCNNNQAKNRMDQACDLLGFDIRSIIFQSSAEELRKTENAQISIFVISMMYFEKWKSLGQDFHIAAGHSLGEYTALCASGVLSFEDTLHLVTVRGRLMAQFCSEDQGMLAVLGLPLEKIVELIKEYGLKVEIANINSQKQIVVSGLKTELSRLESHIAETPEGSVKWLNVGGAFHSSLMNPASDLLGQEIEKITFKEPECIFLSNVTGMEVKDVQEIKENLSIQTKSCVNWLNTILRIKELGATELYEIGPGEVLRKLNSTITFKPKCYSL